MDPQQAALQQALAQLEKLARHCAKISGEHREMRRKLEDVQVEYASLIRAIKDRPRSITDEINEIPGRRLVFNFTQRQDFTVALDGLRGQPMNFLVSQSGPFIMTHYPMCAWLPSAPANATRFGFWRPVTVWPLPDQVVDDDFINLSYELISGGSQRLLNNEPAGPLFSRPDLLMPLPVPTLFVPNDVIQFIPTYEDITFSGAGVPTTQGTLVVTLPGYQVANL